MYLIPSIRETLQQPSSTKKGKAGEVFTRHGGDRTKGNDFELKEGRFRLNISKKFFTVSMVRRCNVLPGEVVDATSREVFRASLGGALSNLI